MSSVVIAESKPKPKRKLQKWYKSIVEMEPDQQMPGAPQSRREQGLEHT